jgi:hypothetical protein
MKAISFSVLFASVLVGCGGSGGGSSDPSPFAGSYSGAFNIPSISQVGTMTVAVTTGGKLTGNYINTTAGTSGTVQGSINSTGTFSGTIKPSGFASSTLNGTLSLSGADLTGTLTQVQGGISYGIQVNLTKG